MYFKTLPFPQNLTHSQVEAALRKASIKETMSLDFKFKAIDIGTDKTFYGMEGKKDLKFTRLQTSFEFFLPKLIISLSRDPLTNILRIRPGAIPIAIFGLLSFGVLVGMIGIFKGTTNIKSLFPFLVMVLIYTAIFFFEIAVTVRKVNKVLSKG